MNLKTSHDSFLQYLQFEKRFSNHTLVAYSTDIRQFYKYCTTSYDIQDLSEINYTLVRSWVVDMIEQKISARSVNRKITALKTFYKYLLRKGLVKENPMLKVQSPKTSKRLPVFVEKDKMDLLLDKIEFGKDLEGLRNKLIIELFYGTGMRLTELIHLKTADVDLGRSQLKVLGKRNKERIIPFHRELAAKIREYLALKKHSEPDFLLLNEKGKKLNEKFVYNLVKSYLSQVTTIDKKSPHVLRHTFATHMLNNGADLNAIKELLGHANLSATQVYTHNTVEKLKNIHKQAHPKA
jgi:integrase/recombinase XerC